jgi:choice-of-anchor A domain-containing protein
MKHLRLTLPAFAVLASFAQVANAEGLGLFDFTVYATDGIQSEHSDFMGLTGSGGDITLKHFEIRRTRSKPTDHLPYAAFAGGTFSLTHGSVNVRRNGSLVQGGVEAHRTVIKKAGTVKTRETYKASVDPSIDHAFMAAEMKAASHRLAYGMAMENPRVVTNNVFESRGPGTINVFNVTAADFESSNAYLKGHSTDVFVINVMARDVSYEGATYRIADINEKAFFFEGTLTPANIIWNFPDADNVRVLASGVDRHDSVRKHWGVPGTILAPNAKVVFYNGLITGAVLSKVFTAYVRDEKGGLFVPGGNGGQVNDACFQGGGTGVGCGAFAPPPPPTDK